MRKVFSLFVVALFAVMMMAGGVWAASTLTNTPAGVHAALIVAAEAISPATAANPGYGRVDGWGTAPKIWYAPTGISALGATSKITITLTNGQFAAADADNGGAGVGGYYMLARDVGDGGNGGISNTIEPDLDDAGDDDDFVGTLLAGGANADFMTFEIMAGKTVAAGEKLAIVMSSASGNNVNDSIANGTDVTEVLEPIVLSSSMTNGTSMTVAVTAVTDATNTAIAAGLVTAAKFVTATSALALAAHDGTLGDIGIDTIDVNQARKYFDAVDDDSADASGFSLNTAAEIATTVDEGQLVHTTGITKVVLAISGDFSCVEKDGGTGDYKVTMTDADAGALTADTVGFTGTEGDGILTLTFTTDTKIAQLVSGSSAADIDVDFEVTGTDALSTRGFKIAADVTTAGAYNDLSFGSTDFATWDINGGQFVVPHMISRNDWESFLVIKTVAVAPASEIFVDLLNRNGDAVTLTKAELATLELEAGSAGGSAYITAGDLLGAAGWATGDMDQDFSATLTFTISQTQVYVDGFKYASGSTYPISVYEKKCYGGGSTANQFVK